MTTEMMIRSTFGVTGMPVKGKFVPMAIWRRSPSRMFKAISLGRKSNGLTLLRLLWIKSQMTWL